MAYSNSEAATIPPYLAGKKAGTMNLFAADENFNNRIVRGLFRAKPDLDIVRVQDAGFSGADDSEARGLI